MPDTEHLTNLRFVRKNITLHDFLMMLFLVLVKCPKWLPCSYGHHPHFTELLTWPSMKAVLDGSSMSSELPADYDGQTSSLTSLDLSTALGTVGYAFLHRTLSFPGLVFLSLCRLPFCRFLVWIFFLIILNKGLPQGLGHPGFLLHFSFWSSCGDFNYPHGIKYLFNIDNP